MKKLLVFREGIPPDSRELDDYLYDSNVSSSDFIDMTPTDEVVHQDGRLALHASEWDVVFKGSDEYDQWHVVCEGSDTYAFEEPAFVAANSFFLPAWKHPHHCSLQIVLHKKNMMVAIWRLSKAMSEVLSMDLAHRLKSYTNGIYTYEIPEGTVGALHAASEKEEVPPAA